MILKLYNDDEEEIVYNVLYSKETIFNSINEVANLVNEFATENGCVISQPILLDLNMSIILDTNTHFKVEYSIYDDEDSQTVSMKILELA